MLQMTRASCMLDVRLVDSGRHAAELVARAKAAGARSSRAASTASSAKVGGLPARLWTGVSSKRRRW